MKPSIFFVRVLGGAFRRVADRLARRLKNNFYLYLAAVFSVLAVLDAFTLHAVVDMRHRAYDVMIRYRIVQPPADPQIVIVDINEASLAAMAADYGRWPWPRQVLGEFLQNLELQKPKAVVFDILFSDPDVFNPDSDAYFDEAVANNSEVYNYFEWNKTRSEIMKHTKRDTRVQPKAHEALQPVTVRFLPPPAGLIVFSGAQMHESVPNVTDVARYSIDFRTVHVDDVMARRGAPNVDSRSTGTTSRTTNGFTT